ncbi:GntR family transcriptional regulator [Hypericibacter adhaerens]|jgi:GntR family transcriptional regulator/MocR family aminotransferase|uniref:GntR family transcriptional regulator n=1 Tax=Hypericibacter adhaerens TaxID=2602016 RepID=A0A5J6MUB7_9PROT|nr:PLP-dependent aminotransferase family protein [Hypericibacter adhaerens]QEX21248.1 GntR family transcriptional regulator [Hypericibacter adhaerens]HVY50099.1 PLP-dependent aminotransferase family protein [Devosia sp.]
MKAALNSRIRLDIRLKRRSGGALHRQIYERLRADILEGRLEPGRRLASSRALASQLGVARGTVELAYATLASEGYVETQAAGGTLVASNLSRQRPIPRGRRIQPVRAFLDPAFDTAQPKPFQMGLPALDLFPRKLWSRLAARNARRLSLGALSYQDAAGDRRLREAIAHYLAIARGLSCSSDQIFVTPGYQGALGLITRVLLRPGDPVWFEDPGYFLAREALKQAGAALVPLPVDPEGIDVEAGRARAPWARFAVVTPSHQAPLGVTLSLNRRLALLAWAAEAGAWVIEDDYDSEYRYRGRPLPALKSLDEANRVLYTGTFSKVLHPGLRLGYLVVPPPELERFDRAASLLMPSQGYLDQMTVADFMTEGHFARHIRRMRQLYAERREALATALERRLGDRLRVDLQAGGLHLLGWLREGSDDEALSQRAWAQGLAPLPLSRAVMQARLPPALAMSFTNVPVEESAAVVERMAAVIEGAG